MLLSKKVIRSRRDFGRGRGKKTKRFTSKTQGKEKRKRQSQAGTARKHGLTVFLVLLVRRMLVS